MNRRQFVFGTAAAAGAGIVGVSAFTTADATRDVNIGVVADDSAVIGLTPDDTEIASLDDDGVLVIDTDIEGAGGLNPDANFTYGDPDNFENNHLFSIANNSASEREFTIEFTGGNGVTFTLYSNTGIDGDEVTDEGSQTFTLGDGETVYVVLDVDTDGTSDGDEIGGELSIDATATENGGE